MNRFDNLSIEELIAREREAFEEAEDVAEALKARMLAECPLKVGHVYRFNSESIRAGQEALVCSLRPDRWAFHRPHHYFLGVHGFLATKKSTAGDGFGRRPKIFQGWEQFDLASERPGPRDFHE